MSLQGRCSLSHPFVQIRRMRHKRVLCWWRVGEKWVAESGFQAGRPAPEAPSSTTAPSRFSGPYWRRASCLPALYSRKCSGHFVFVLELACSSWQLDYRWRILTESFWSVCRCRQTGSKAWLATATPSVSQDAGGFWFVWNMQKVSKRENWESLS